jgi:hypothetical protein
MGIEQWTRWYIPANHDFCKKYKLKPGDYLIMYKSSSGVLLIKDILKGDVLCKVPLSRIIDDNPTAYNEELLDAIQRLKEKDYESAGGGYSNHHIILHHLCKKSRLMIEGERYGVFNKDGSENLIRLPDAFHIKYHGPYSQYSKTMYDILQERWSDLVEAGLDEDPDQIQQAILEIVDVTRERLEELMKSPGSTIRDF